MRSSAIEHEGAEKRYPRALPVRLRALVLVLAVLVLASCGGEREPGPAADVDPFVVRTDAELDAAITDARARARSSGRRVLLDLVADWCSDCREVVRVS